MKQHVHCNGCDGAKCSSTTGTIRLLPVSKNPDDGNMALCFSCYRHEMKYRNEQSPKWVDLALVKHSRN